MYVKHVKPTPLFSLSGLDLLLTQGVFFDNLLTKGVDDEKGGDDNIGDEE